MTSIVQVSVSQVSAPTPATLQQTGAFISQGATVLAPGGSQLLTQYSDITPYMTGAKAITSMAWAGGVVTVTTAAPHGYTVGDTLLEVIAGVFPVAYNVTALATVTGASTFTYPLANGGTSPGTVTTQGVFSPEDVGELNAMALTFFSQGSNQAVYVLELGPGNPNDGVAALQTYIQAQPNSGYRAGRPGYFYRYLVPRTWDAVPSFLALIATQNFTTARTYFRVTTTLATLSAYVLPSKSVEPFIESPAMGVYPQTAISSIALANGVATATTATAHGVGVGQWFQVQGAVPNVYNGWAVALAGTAGTTLVWAEPAATAAATTGGTVIANAYANAGVSSTEFSAAAPFYRSLAYRPGAVSKVAPFAFGYLFGVTAFPQRGNAALTANLLSGYNGATIPGDFVDTGAEGGISNTIVANGLNGDGLPLNYWYSADWVQINLDLDTANEVINGSNNSINPLYYNQPGVNRLQARANATMTRGNRFGLVLFPPVQTQLTGPDLTAALDALNNQVPGALYGSASIVNAIPFVQYTKDNPSDYKIGRYAGFSVVYTPQLGFKSIVYNVLISTFVTG